MAADDIFRIAGADAAFTIRGASYVITDCFHLSLTGSAKEALLELGKVALHEVVLRHPKMRTRVVQGDEEESRHFEILLDLSPAALDAMWRVTLPTEAEGPRHWERVAFVRGNTPVDRSAESLWSLDLILAAPGEDPATAHLVVAADHSVADGFSTCRVAHDFLSAVSKLSCLKEPVNVKEACSQSEEESIQNLLPQEPPHLFEPLEPLPSAMSLVLGPKGGDFFLRHFGALTVRQTFKRVARVVEQNPSVLPLHESVLKNPELLEEPPHHTTWNLFALGDRERFRAARQRCKEENVTFHGPLVAAIVAAYSRIALKPSRTGWGREKIKMLLDVEWNLRKRLLPSLGEDHVGNLVGMGTLGFLKPSRRAGRGVPLSAKFWDVARRAKKSTEDQTTSWEGRLAHLFFDEAFRSYDLFRSIFHGSQGGSLGDVNLSNIGVFPFPTVYEVGAGSTIRILSHHLVSSGNIFASPVVIFASAVDGVPGYSLSYRTEHGATSKMFTDLVSILEGIGSIEPDATIEEVFQGFCGSVGATEAPLITSITEEVWPKLRAGVA